MTSLALVTPFLGLLFSIIVFARVGVLFLDTLGDMLKSSMHPRLMATWSSALALEVLILMLCAGLGYVCVLTIRANWV